MQLFFVIVISVFAIQAYPASINVHWTPTIGGGTSHGTTVSVNIWINLTQANDSDYNTIESMTFTEGYIQEQSHNAPQIPLSMSQITTLPSCCGTGKFGVNTDPSVIFSLSHNASYKIYIKSHVMVHRMMPYGLINEYDTEQTAYVTGNNLHFTSSPNDVIAWDPASMSSVNISSAWDDEQTGTCSLTYNIYSTGGGLVYTKQFTNQSRPGSSSWSWDGKDSQGATVEKGLYTVKATVTSNIPTVSSDCNRSSYLEIMRVNYEAEYIGVDDNGTPSIENDDMYLFYLKSYKLKDTAGSDASEGTIRLYDPSLAQVGSWNISNLYCVDHDAYDGLETDTSGLAHKLLIRVPVSLMQTDGDYRFVARVKDSHANDYKGHTNKWALELNEKSKISQLVMVTPPENQTTVYVGETSGTEENRIFYKQFVADTVPAVDGLSVKFYLGNDYATVSTSSNGRYTTNNWNITTKRSPKTVYTTSNGAKQSGNATVHFKKNGQLITCAPDSIGSPYVSGGNGPDVFDCSGFLYWLYNHIGIPLADNTAQGYYTSSIKVDEEDLLPGDWIFFDWGSDPPSSSSIDHTGVYIGNIGTNKVMIHASSTADIIKYETLTEYYENHSEDLYGHYYGANERF